ncbi:phosphatidate cytidylyltransferase [Flavobacteriaceae bacterium]|nr:phosphatidate cytidylyltransferase [Flavobacteriaceae bacterium]
MLQRAISGAIFIAILITATIYSSISFFVLFLFFMIVAVYEFQKLSKYKSSYLYVIGLTSFLFSDGAFNIYKDFIEISTSTQGKLQAATYVLLFVGFLKELFNSQSKTPYEDLGKLFLTYFYAIVPFAFILNIPFTNNLNSYEGTTLLGCLFLIWSTDTFAYLTGKSIGKTKLFERISPNKTIEGSAGGVLITLGIAYIISLYFTQYSLVEWLGLSILISVFGSLGDLVESMFKRAANIKDSGNLIPGHGGVLDRFDSLIFAAPFIYFYLQLIS